MHIYRALQIFKNKKILDLIKDHGTKKSSINTNKFNRNIGTDKNNNLHRNDYGNDKNDITNNNNKDNNDIGENNVDCYKLNVQEPLSLDSVLTALIPALFRGGNLRMFNRQNLVRIVCYTYFYCLYHITCIMKISRIIQMDVLIQHIFQEISQYVLIRIHNKHTQVAIYHGILL
jgi:hypothetical protein